MKIEEEIKQNQFQNEEHKAIINLLFTHNWLVRQMTPLFSDSEITMAQYNILRILRGQKPGQANISMIKERMLDKQPDVSRLLERLQDKNLVKKKADSNDLRKAWFSITDKGLRCLENLDPQINNFSGVMKNLNATEKKTLNGLLDKMRD